MSVNSLFNQAAPSAAANNGAAAAATAGSANSTNSNNTISESTFMNLMVEELQNQDPTNPMSNTDYISELAQFSSMNQLTSMNSTLQSLVSSQNQATLSSAVSLVGQPVQANGNTFGFTNGGNTALNYSLPSNANAVSLDVYDTSGNLVYNTNLGSQNSGNQSFNWDGLENNGSSAPSGNYTFSVGGTGTNGKVVTAATYTDATVTGLSTSSSGAVQLELSNGSTVPLSSITNVG
ncbi:MAG: flagellar hook assembly protein FlgD [bacterium]